MMTMTMMIRQAGAAALPGRAVMMVTTMTMITMTAARVVMIKRA
jgi:hypothetical protein